MTLKLKNVYKPIIDKLIYKSVLISTPQYQSTGCVEDYSTIINMIQRLEWSRQNDSTIG